MNLPGGRFVTRTLRCKCLLLVFLAFFGVVPRCFRWNRSRRPGQAGGMPSGKSSRPVPQGRPRIAQRFIAGNQGGLARSPTGTEEISRSSRSPKSQGSVVPAGLAGRPAPPPSVETLGYYLSPSGLGEGAFHRKQRRTFVVIPFRNSG